MDGKDALLSFDWSGKEVWQKTFGPEDRGKHRNGSGCNASPTTDGEGVFVYFKSGTLAALELDGTVRWETNLVKQYGRDVLFWDQGTSPVLTRKHVVMTRIHQGESWLAAFDKRSGAMEWKVARNYDTPTEGDHGYYFRDTREGMIDRNPKLTVDLESAEPAVVVSDTMRFTPDSKQAVGYGRVKSSRATPSPSVTRQPYSMRKTELSCTAIHWPNRKTCQCKAT